MAAYLNFKSKKNLKRWTDTRKRGFWPFVVKAGILGWGIPVSFLVTGLDWYQGVPLNELGVPLAIRLVLFGLLGGVAFGATMWKFSQYQYAKAAANANKSEPAA